MTELDAPDCKIFVDADVTETELMGMIGQLLTDGPDTRAEMEFFVNEDFDEKRRKLFPDGFIYFRYFVDLYMSTPEDKVPVVATILRQLWYWGFPAVAACNYEDQLPEHGGYKSRAVPWP